MFNGSVASSSRHTIEDFWDPPNQQSQFPTSDLRSIDRHSLRSTTPPLRYVFSSQGISSFGASHTKYASLLPLRKQIEPGVWSDGSDRVLSAACPTVQAFLKRARRSMGLPPAPSESVFALAALDVFYQIDDPAHWIFWNDEKKHQTAEVVSRISLHRPQLIHSRVAWNGIPEYLFILSGLHGASSLPIYGNKEWYPILNPSKIPSPPRIINLRKRKVQRAEPNEPFENADMEEVEPRPKRPKPASSLNQKRPESPSVGGVDISQTEVLEKPLAPARIVSAEDTGALPLSSIAAFQDQDTIPSDNTVKNTHPTNHVLNLTILHRETSPKSTPALLTPVEVTHSRNRSISQASSQTIVSAYDRRSVSVLSAITAVEVPTPLGEGDEAINVHQTVSDSEESKEEPRMITRGRANKARRVVQNKGASGRAKRTKRKAGVK